MFPDVSVPSVRGFSLDEAASLLSVCRRTLEREIAAGRFPVPLKIRGRSVVPEADLRAYVAKLEEQQRGVP